MERWHCRCDISPVKCSDIAYQMSNAPCFDSLCQYSRVSRQVARAGSSNTCNIVLNLQRNIVATQVETICCSYDVIFSILCKISLPGISCKWTGFLCMSLLSSIRPFNCKISVIVLQIPYVRGKSSDVLTPLQTGLFLVFWGWGGIYQYLKNCLVYSNEIFTG